MEYTLNEKNFQTEVISSSLPVMVDFYADWCNPCKMMAPLVKKLAGDYEGKIKIGKLNIDENTELAQKYRVMSIPSFLFFKDGSLTATVVGAVSESELKQKLELLL